MNKITIVIMLILATVTIGAINGGLFEYAGKAKKEVAKTEEVETIQEAYIIAKGNSKTGRITSGDLQKAINSINKEDEITVVINGDTLAVIINEKNYYYDVNTKGNVEGPFDIIPIEYAGDITKNNSYNGNSTSNAYRITCIEDLVTFSNMSNGKGYKLDANGNTVAISRSVTFNGQYVLLTKDLDFKSVLSYKDYTTKIFGDINGDGTTQELMTELTTGEGFMPIGGNFAGTFSTEDEEVHYIKNLYENRLTGYAGLFGTTGPATIKNIGITGEITGTTFTGGIVGYVYNVNNMMTIENCINYAKVTGKTSVAGIAGHITGVNTIKNCINQGEINITYTNWSYSGAAGIMATSLNEFLIQDCSNYGKIKGNGICGGICASMQSGQHDNRIENCKNLGEVSSATSNSGGIMGSAKSGTYTIINCMNSGKIGENSVGKNGGILGGSSSGSWTAEIEVNIYNSSNLGEINSTSKTTGGIIGEQGTICKTNILNMENCYNSGEVKGTKPGAIIGSIVTKDGSKTTDTTTAATNVYYTDKYENAGIYSGSLTSGTITEKEDADMKLQAFVTLLNTNRGNNSTWKEWKYKSGEYPSF